MAEHALEYAQTIDSEVYIADTANIYQKLKQSPYKDSPDVARLDYLLSNR